MDRRHLLWALSGLGFLGSTVSGLLVLNFFTSALYPSPLDRVPGPSTDVAVYFVENRAQVHVASLLYMLGGFCLLLFVAFGAGLATDRARTRTPALSALAVSASSLAVGFWFTTAMLMWVLAEPETGQAPGLLRPLHAFAYLVGGPAHVLTLGVFTAAVSAATWGERRLPRWVTYAGGGAGAASLLSLSAFVWQPGSLFLPLGRGLELLWILAICVLLLRGRLAELPIADRQQVDASRD